MGFWVYFSDDKVEFYDSDACKLYLAPDRIIPIVQNSKVIFDYLIENRNHALYRDQIIAQIDGVDAGHNFNNKQSDRSPVDTAIRELRKKLEKYKSCIDTVRGVGYMYVGPPKVEKESSDTHTNPLSSDSQTKKRKLAESILEENDENDSSTSEQSRKSLKTFSQFGYFAQQQGEDIHNEKDNAIKLSALFIHKNSKEHPKIDKELEIEIRYIIDLLEQGLSEDFEEICEQAWAELNLVQKAMKIFRAYENLTDRSRNLSPTDQNTRL